MKLYDFVGYFDPRLWSSLIHEKPETHRQVAIYVAQETGGDPVSEIIDDSFRVQIINALNFSDHLKVPYRDAQVDAILGLIEARLEKFFELAGSTPNLSWGDHIDDLREGITQLYVPQ